MFSKEINLFFFFFKNFNILLKVFQSFDVWQKKWEIITFYYSLKIPGHLYNISMLLWPYCAKLLGIIENIFDKLISNIYIAQWGWFSEKLPLQYQMVTKIYLPTYLPNYLLTYLPKKLKNSNSNNAQQIKLW